MVLQERRVLQYLQVNIDTKYMNMNTSAKHVIYHLPCYEKVAAVGIY